jgi:hypothetical protein
MTVLFIRASSRQPFGSLYPKADRELTTHQRTLPIFLSYSARFMLASIP